MRRVCACGLVIVAALACAPQAAGHGVIRKEGGVITYSAPDPGVGAKLVITSPRPGAILFSDRRSPGGIDWGPCFPVSQRQAQCSTGGVSRLEIEVFDGDDIVIARVATPVLVDAGPGNDRIVGGYGRDALDGGPGNDFLLGGEGGDSIVGDTGDDTIEIRDGASDPFSCGGGTDTVIADPSDPRPPLLECENLSIASPPPDRAAPKASVSKKPLKLRRKLQVKASINEPGTITLAGHLLIGKRKSGKLTKATAKPNAPGQTWTLKPAMTRQSAKKAKRALASGKRVRVALAIKAEDRSGNARKQRLMIRVRS